MSIRAQFVEHCVPQASNATVVVFVILYSLLSTMGQDAGRRPSIFFQELTYLRLGISLLWWLLHSVFDFMQDPSVIMNLSISAHILRVLLLGINIYWHRQWCTIDTWRILKQGHLDRRIYHWVLLGICVFSVSNMFRTTTDFILFVTDKRSEGSVSQVRDFNSFLLLCILSYLIGAISITFFAVFPQLYQRDLLLLVAGMFFCIFLTTSSIAAIIWLQFSLHSLGFQMMISMVVMFSISIVCLYLRKRWSTSGVGTLELINANAAIKAQSERKEDCSQGHLDLESACNPPAHFEGNNEIPFHQNQQHAVRPVLSSLNVASIRPAEDLDNISVISHKSSQAESVAEIPIATHLGMAMRKRKFCINLTELLLYNGINVLISTIMTILYPSLTKCSQITIDSVIQAINTFLFGGG